MSTNQRLICLFLIYAMLILATMQCVHREAEGGKWAKDKYEITAYCPCAICCGHETGITATGYPVQVGTVAVDPKIIPYFSVLRVEGFKQLFIAMDSGRLIKGKRLDLYYPTHEAAVQFGRKKLAIKIWKPKAEFDPLKGIGEILDGLFAKKPLCRNPLFIFGNMVGGILK